MKKRHALVAALALAAPWLVTGPAGASEEARGHGRPEVPVDCAVPPDIDLDGFHLVIGTDKDDRLKGTNGPDFICGCLGDDRIDGRGGDDLILGDTSTFFGNVDAEGGDDEIDAGRGNDQVLSGPGDDEVEGGSGDDFLALAVGDDEGEGDSGADTVNGG